MDHNYSGYITLYRGTSLLKDYVEKDYFNNKGNYFSWNCFTSTSIKESVTDRFMFSSKEKTPVIFKILVNS